MRALPGRESRTSIAHPPARVTRRTVKDDQRRRIRLATGELVAERGYNAVTVELIVKRARVSFKTFYKHFSGKEECFLELFDVTTARTRERVAAVLAAEADSPWPQQVAAAVRAIFASFLADPLIARATIVEAPTAGPIIVERYEQMTKALTPLLSRGRQFSSEADELPAMLEETLGAGVLWSAYQRLIVGDVEQIEALCPEAIEFVLRPYVGEVEAARWAKWSPEQPAQSASTAP
jgi:AcrR family transcriptional regulator